MITAIDSNILFDLLRPNPAFVKASARAIESSAASGSLVICDIVFAEICGHFASPGDCDRFLEESDIRTESLTKEACFKGSRSWRTYLEDGGAKKRILADFLIGAHAQTQATRLLTRDRGFYGKLFPRLVIFDPTSK